MASFLLGPAPQLFASLTKNIGVQASDILPVALRLALIGVISSYAKTLVHSARVWWSQYFYARAYITHDDPAFPWIMSFLAQDPSVQSQLRSFRLTTVDSRESKNSTVLRLSSSKNDRTQLQLLGPHEASFVSEHVIGQKVPVNDQGVLIIFQGHRLWIERRRYSDAYGYNVDHLRIKTIFYQRSAIEDFLATVHDHYFRHADDELMIFHASPWSGSWYDPISRPARHWDSVILPSHIKNGLLADVEDFLSEEDREWYAVRGIPHRRGYLLHGRPGSGKTTLVTAIASHLKLSIRVISPAARGMHDQKLNLVFRSCNQGDLILIEDIDCVMPTKRQKDDNDGLFETEEKDSKNKNYLPRSTVTLSGLLNAIDGVSSQEGCILFATTNHPEFLDHALTRSGRFDVRVAFHDATTAQAAELFKRFYHPAGAIQSSEKCDTDESDFDLLAQRFAETVIPSDNSNADLNISMAALQGFLLEHKKDETGAVEQAKVWIDRLRQEKMDKEEQERIREEQEMEKKEKREEKEEERRSRREAKKAKREAEMPLTPVSPTSDV